MTDLTEGIDEVVEQLETLSFKGQGLRVVTRLEDVNPPCVWVALETIDHLTLGGGLELTERIFLVSGDIDEYRAIKTLSPLLADVLSIIQPSEPTTVVALNIPGQQQALPALRVTNTNTII